MVPITKDEKEEIKRESKKRGLSMASFLRMAAKERIEKEKR